MSYRRSQQLISKRSRFIRSNTYKKYDYIPFRKMFMFNEQLIEFPCFSLLGGHRGDPLNLNELIQKKRQSTGDLQMNVHGNDQPIEILLPPNISDPLNLDITSYRNSNSLSFTSVTNQCTTIQHIQSIKQKQADDQQVPAS